MSHFIVTGVRYLLRLFSPSRLAMAGYFFIAIASSTSASEIDFPAIASFGSNPATVSKNLAGRCTSLSSHTVAKRLDIAALSQQELRCEGFEYLGKKRPLTLVFSDAQLDIIEIAHIRPIVLAIQNTLNQRYGAATLSSRRADYYSKPGISVEVALDKILFISPRAQPGYMSYLGTLKNHPVKTNLTREQWLQDLAALDQHIRNAHINPFWHNNEAGYMALFYQAHQYITDTGQLDSHIINGHFEKMVAWLADGHSYVVDKAGRFGVFPYRLEWFGNEIFIVNTEKKYAHLLGAKVIGFDSATIEQANARIAPFIATVNPSSFKHQARDAYQFGGLLYSAGISNQADRVMLHVQLQNGEQTSQLFTINHQSKPAMERIDLHENAGVATPLYRQAQDKNQWFTFLEKEGVLYVRYAWVIEKTTGDIATLSKNIQQFIAHHNVNKLIIDVRNNGGGDSHFNAPLINTIVNSEKINQWGKLFVLTNHNTFSAAINFVGNMEIKTRALFIGEPVGDSASFAGESGPQAKYTLPNSHILVSLSFSEWNSTYDNDQRNAPALDVPVTLHLQDILLGRDPVLQAALDYSTPHQPVVAIGDNSNAWIGRYDYSPDKALKIFVKNHQLEMEITELAFSRLYTIDENTVQTDMRGIQLKRHANGNIELIQQGSVNRILKKLSTHPLKPLELLLAGKFAAAKAGYQCIYRDNPALLSIRGNSLGILASHIKARHNNQKLYDQLREIALSLHGDPITSWDDY